MKSFITGITGFVGSYLGDYLVSLGHEVAGIDINEKNSKNLTESEKIHLYIGSTLDDTFIKKILSDYKPDWIFHLAGIASVHQSWINKKQTYETNIMGAFNLLEACTALPEPPRILLVGSAEEYGKVNTSNPINEECALNGFTPYAISKITQEYLGLHYYHSMQLPVIRTRSFNHTGPRQSTTFVCSSFCHQVAEIELTNKEPILHVGNLSSYRDFTDVRDVIKAYVTLMEKGTIPDVYNVCRMKAYNIKELLEIILSYSTKIIKIDIDESRYRAIEIPFLLGDNSRIKKLGWEPKYTIEQTLLDTLNYWRNALKK